MNISQFRTYINHFIKARHYRGHGIHSPYLYSYVRNVVIKDGDICQMTKQNYPDKLIDITEKVSDALNSNAYISILEFPFSSKKEKQIWDTYRPSMNILTIHLPHHIIIFRDYRVHNQHFLIRR